MTKILLSLILLFLHACSQTPVNDNSPMLWEISGNGLKSPSYLFGTFHTRDKDINTLASSVYNALKTSQVLYTEIPMSLSSQQEVTSFTKLKKAHPLEKRLNTKTLRHLNRYLEETHSAFKLFHFNPYKTWAIALILANQEDEILNPDTPFMDEQLVEIAKKYRIEHQGLETPLEQLLYFDSLTQTEQVLFLTDMLDQIEDKEYTDALITWYKQGKASGFTTLQKKFESSNLKQQALDIKLLEGLLYERNVRFEHRILMLLRSKAELSYFFAIGAGHLSDELGLVSRLNSAGYTLKKLN